MKNTSEDIERLRCEFQECQNIFTALGDVNRQRLLCIMLGGEKEIEKLMALFSDIRKVMKNVPDRSSED